MLARLGALLRAVCFVRGGLDGRAELCAVVSLLFLAAALGAEDFAVLAFDFGLVDSVATDFSGGVFFLVAGLGLFAAALTEPATD